MKVFKFGGASVSSADRIRNVVEILKKYSGDELLVVVSAMGKTTNALEKVVESFYAREKDRALQLFKEIKDNHIALMKQLCDSLPSASKCENRLNDFFTEVEWLLHD